MKPIWKIIIMIQAVIIFSFMILYFCSDNTEEIITDNIQIISAEYHESEVQIMFINNTIMPYSTDKEYIVKVLYNDHIIKSNNKELYEMVKDHIGETLSADIKINKNPKLGIEKVTIDKVYINKEEVK